jgi:hypothetical protein
MHRRLMLSICAALSMSVGGLIASDARADSTVCTATTSPPRQVPLET